MKSKLAPFAFFDLNENTPGSEIGELFDIKIDDGTEDGIFLTIRSLDNAEDLVDRINRAHQDRMNEEVRKAKFWAQYQCGCAKCVNPTE